MLVCTVCAHLMLVYTRGPLRGLAITHMHSSIFYRSMKGTARESKKVHSWAKQSLKIIFARKVLKTKCILG
jgi:hypothetical protein